MTRAKRNSGAGAGGSKLAPPALFHATSAPAARDAAWAALSWHARDAWLEAAAAAGKGHANAGAASVSQQSDVEFALALGAVKQARESDGILNSKVQALLACVPEVPEAAAEILKAFGIDATLPRSGAARFLQACSRKGLAGVLTQCVCMWRCEVLTPSPCAKRALRGLLAVSRVLGRRYLPIRKEFHHIGA